MQEEISFGAWLRQQRRALDLTQKAFADQVGCAEITVRRMEADKYKPSNELALVLFEKLGIPEPERAQWVRFARGLSNIPQKSIQGFIPFQRSTNLPAPITTFIGREREQSDVIRLIAKHRLVTLTGSGGVGKTRLSLKVGEQVLGNYADGVWLVELAPILDPLLVSRTTAIAIGLRDESQRPVIDMLSDYLRGKEMLLVLDNCEHLLEACAKLADTLLKNCPNLKILVTSREALGILGEAVYPVPSLELPDFQQLLQDFRGYESVRLFEERAQLTQINFSLTMENASDVAKICTHLDGIPLAIELAAARINTFSTQQIEKRLRESFSLLNTGNRAALPRHQTLQAAIDWSYDLLSPAEQTLFRRLSVFVNGWTLKAARSICADANIQSEAILDLLTQLINKSLIIMDEKQAETRYRMLETIRQYANEKLVESGERDALRDRHLDYFLRLAETAEPHLIRPEQLEWLPLLYADYENLRFAFECALSQNSPTSSLRLCAALGPFWSIRSHFLEGSEWLKTALSKSSQNPGRIEKAARVRALYHDAELAHQLGDLERAQSSAKSSFALAQQIADKRDIAIARFYVGLALKPYTRVDDARFLIEQSLNEFRELNESYWEAYAFRQLAYVLQMQGKLKYGEWYLQALELARKAGERLNLADALSEYSKLFYNSNRIDEAMKYVEEADMLYKQAGSRMNQTSLAFAAIAWLNGDPQEARSLYMEMHERYALSGEKSQKSAVTDSLGRIALEEGNLDQAQAYFEEALATARELENQARISSRLAELSNIFYLQGKVDKYKRYLTEGIVRAKVLSKASKVYFLLYALNSIHLQEPGSSVCILGAIYASERENGSPIIGPLERRYYDRVKSHTREKLGNAAFVSAFAQGQKMSLEEALDLMLKTVEEV